MSLGRRGETFSQVAEENKGTSVSGLWHRVLWAPQLKGWQSPGLFRRPFFKNNRVFGLFPIRKITALATDIRWVPQLRRNRVLFPLSFLITPQFGNSLERFDCCSPFLLFFIFYFYFWRGELRLGETGYWKVSFPDQACKSFHFIYIRSARTSSEAVVSQSKYLAIHELLLYTPSSFLTPADKEQAFACWPSSEA